MNQRVELLHQEGHSRPVIDISFQCDGSICATGFVFFILNEGLRRGSTDLLDKEAQNLLKLGLANKIRYYFLSLRFIC